LKVHQTGRSSRTPVKHFLLHSIMGKVVGSLTQPKTPCRANPFYCVDLCGGDGLETEAHQASPIILHKHCQWLRGKGFDSTLDVIELHELTYEQLRTNTSHLEGVGDWMRITQGDSRKFVLPTLGMDQAAFVHCDPNSVDQMPLAGPLVKSFNRYTMFLVTLGCNVAGLKRLPLDRRRAWFGYVTMLAEVLPAHHDALLFWLNRDQSQWAYLLSLPAVWSERYQGNALRKANNIWPFGVSSASLRRQEKDFVSSINRLFLTGAEYADVS
jgi:hypothetical protein